MSNAKAKSLNVKPVAPSTPAEPKRKGRVFLYVATSKGLVPWEELQKSEIKKSAIEERSKSKQRKTEQTYMMDNGLVPPPFNYSGLLTLQDNCSYFDACVRQIAKDVCGQSWALTLKADEVEDGVMEKGITDFLKDPNTEEDAVDDILERMVIDWGLMGMMCLEVVRERPEEAPPDYSKADGSGMAWATADDPKPGPSVIGNINGLYHVPAHTIRPHKDGNKFCQIINSKYTWFKRFGYGKDVDVNTGAERDPASAAQAYAGAPLFDPANEMIVYRNYYPQSLYYGAPQILSAVGAVKALIGIRDYNLAFFENYGVPAAIVTVEGDWEEDSVKQISDFIDVEIKGSNNAHKTIVVNPPEGGTIKWDPLVVEVKEGSFKIYFTQLRDEVLVCYKMPPYRIGIETAGALGGNVASEATRIYIDSIVNPLKRIVNHILTEKIVGDGFTCTAYEFKLGELDVRDLQSIAARAVILFGIGAKSRNEIREMMGDKKLDPKKDPTADSYFISASYHEIGAEASNADAAAQAAAMGDAFKALKSDIVEALKRDQEQRERASHIGIAGHVE